MSDVKHPCLDVTKTPKDREQAKLWRDQIVGHINNAEKIQRLDQSPPSVTEANKPEWRWRHGRFIMQAKRRLAWLERQLKQYGSSAAAD